MTRAHLRDGGHEIFVSYAHENTDWVDALELDKDPASTESASFWIDRRQIHPSDRWDREARQALDRARAAVLLVSSQFLDSPSINKYELPSIMNRYRNKTISVVFVPIGQVNTDEVQDKLKLANIRNIISIPPWSEPLSAVAPRGPCRDIRERIVSAATEPKEVQNLRINIAFQYELKKKLGDGLFSTLYSAYDRQLERDVAIKLLREAHRTTSFKLNDYFTLVKRVAKVTCHSNILSVYSAYLNSDPPHYVVEYVAGEPLHAFLDDYSSGEPRPIGDVKKLLTAIGSAINHAHRKGLHDLNIRPDNIIVGIIPPRMIWTIFST